MIKRIMPLRTTALTSHLLERIAIATFLSVLIALSVVFYKERIIFTDTVGSIMDVLKKDGFNVTTNRYVSVLGQVLPVLAYKLGMSLRTIIFLYSLNLILLPVILVVLSMYWFKETRTAWSILLFYTIMSARLFYYPISEFQCGLCLLLFYVGLYEHSLTKDNPPNAAVFWFLSLCFIPTIVFSHPLSILVLGAWLLFQICTSQRELIKPLVIAALAVASHLVKKTYFDVPYDSEKTKSLENFKNFSLSYLDETLANQFFKALRDDYFLIPFLIILSIIALVRMRNYFSAILFFVILLGFWLLITVSFKNEPYWYYSEHMYQPVSFFVAVVFGRAFTVGFPKTVAVPTLMVTMIFCLNKVYHGHEPMRKRLDWYTACFDLMDKRGIKKTIVGIDRVDIGWKMEANWLTMYESLVLSSLDKPENAKTITLVWNEHDSRKALNQGHSFVNVAIEQWPIHEVPEYYFKLGNSNYTVLADAFTDREIRSLNYNKGDEQINASGDKTKKSL